MRDAKDRFPELRLLRVFVFLGFFQRAVLQRDGRLSRAFDQAGIALLAGQLLWFLFFRFVHFTARPSTAGGSDLLAYSGM